VSTQPASQLWSRSLEESAVLPNFTLTGPLELVLTEAQPINLYVPHQADSGLVRRILLQPGASLSVHNIKTVALRRPIDLPLPLDAYLANIWGRPVRGTVPGAADSSLSGECHYLPLQIQCHMSSHLLSWINAFTSCTSLVVLQALFLKSKGGLQTPSLHSLQMHRRSLPNASMSLGWLSMRLVA